MPEHILHHLRLFIASPGGLDKERRTAKRIVTEMNPIIGRRLRWSIDITGWEDIGPDYGRPQEIINKAVDECDLFLGLIWESWGQPTGAEHYTSGFQEEFERVRNRRIGTGRPDIWLAFKKVSSEKLRDPGVQLQQVLAFRKAHETSKELFFNEFNSLKDWETKLRRWLWDYILKLPTDRLQAIATSPAVSAPISSTAAYSTVPSLSNSELRKSSADRQLLEVLASAKKAIEQGNLGYQPKGEDPLDRFLVSRLSLLAATWLEDYTSEVFGVHKINLIYQDRSKLDLTQKEQFLILRTLIGDPHNVAPGWYWLSNSNTAKLDSLLFYLAMHDHQELVRAGALNILKWAKIPPPTEGRFYNTLKLVLNDESYSVRMAGMAYLETMGGSAHLPLFEDISADKDVVKRDRALQAKLLILTRDNPNEVVSGWLANSQVVSENILSLMEQRALDVSQDLLLELLNHSDAALRAWAAKVLVHRNQLPSKIAYRLLKDSSVAVKEAAYLALIEQGESITPDQIRESFKKKPKHILFDPEQNLDREARVLHKLYHSFTADALLAAVDWSFDGALAYRVLAVDYFPSISDRIRSDLNDQFETLKEDSIVKLRSKFAGMGDNIIAELTAGKIANFLRARFTSAALAGLVAHGEPTDIIIGRRYLDDSDDQVQLEATRLIERFGDKSDVDALLRLAKNSYKPLNEIAAQAALKLSPRVVDTVCTLLRAEDPVLVRSILKALWHADLKEMETLLEPFLESKDEKTRLQILAYLSKRCSPEALEQLLLRYLKKAIYFYDVVCWLDRLLYAPSPLKELYRHKLESELDGSENII